MEDTRSQLVWGIHDSRVAKLRRIQRAARRERVASRHHLAESSGGIGGLLRRVGRSFVTPTDLD